MKNKYILNYYNLQIRDIILQSGKKLHSQAIKLYTKSNYSHTMICVDKVSLVHAQGEGVFSLNPQRILVENVKDFKVLRLKKDLNKEQQIEIEKFLRSQIGSLYSFKDALKVAIKNKDKKAENKQFCSRLVAQAYSHIDIKLVDDIDFCSPADIENSKFLEVVPNMIRKATKTDIEFANTPNMIEENQKHLFEWLNKVRDVASKYDFEIVNILNVDEFLIKYPKEDKIVCNFIIKSGYLEDYKIEVKNNLHMHNVELFKERYKENLEEALIMEFSNMLSPLERHIQNYKNSILNYKNSKLEYYKLHMDLYKNLLQVFMSKLIVLFEISKDIVLSQKANSQIVIVLESSKIYIERLKELGIEVKVLNMKDIF